jgi:hypothetical protein
MLPITDTTFDLLVLQLILHTSSLGLLLLGVLTPVCARSENDVLTANLLGSKFSIGKGDHEPNTCCIGSRSSAILGREPKLRPLFPLRNSWIHNLLMYREPDSASSLDLLAIIVPSPADYGLSTILICSGGIGGELCDSVVELFVISPVGAA